MGIISSTTTSGNFSAATDIDSLSYAIPAGCTKIYVIGMARLQAQSAPTQDISLWIDYNAGAILTKSAIFTSVNSFNGSTVALIDTINVSGAGGTTKTFKLRATAGNLANVGNRTILLIPAYA